MTEPSPLDAAMQAKSAEIQSAMTQQRRLTDTVTEIPVIGTIQRASDEQINALVAGEVVTFSQEQLLAVLKWSGVGKPLVVNKTQPGVFEVYSESRISDPISDLLPPTEQ